MSMARENGAPIRVLIADDSAVMRSALSRIVESSPAMKVCGTARHGLDVLEKIRQLQPDVLTLDVKLLWFRRGFGRGGRDHSGPDGALAGGRSNRGSGTPASTASR